MIIKHKQLTCYRWQVDVTVNFCQPVMLMGNCSWVSVYAISGCTCEIFVLILGSIGSLLITNWHHGAGVILAEMWGWSCQVVQ